MILLAQARQADRDKAINETDTNHRETLAARTIELLERANQQTIQLHELLDVNTRLTEEVSRLATEIHRAVAPSRQ